MDYRKRSNAPDLIYYDIVLRNIQENDIDIYNQLEYNETRNQPIIICASDYKLSIVRFEMDTYTIPVFIPQIQRNQSDPNLTVYSITVQYDDNLGNIQTIQQYVNWVPQNKNIQIPVGPSQNNDTLQTNSLYYYSYNFGHFVKLLNNTLSTAYTSLKNIVNDLQFIETPYFSWNNSSSTLVFNGRNSIFNINTYPQVRVYFNRSLYSLLSSFSYIKDSNLNNGRIYQLMLDPNYGANIIIIPTNNNPYISLEQEYSTVSNWSPISSIVFTSSTLPVVPTQLSSPFIYNGTLIESITSSNQFYESIITDMSVETIYQPTILYTPTAEYRFIDLVGEQPIKQIDIRCYFRDKIGRLNPFLVVGGCGMTMKILFQKK